MSPQSVGATGSKEEKAALRQWAVARRATLNMPAESVVLTERLKLLLSGIPAQHLLIYSAMPDEVNLHALTADVTRHWYLPRCAPKRRLAIHTYVPAQTPLRIGPFGIQEPDAIQVPETDPEILDVVIVPALLLTPEGERLGYGGGYYDRFLPRLRPDCLTIGILPRPLIVPELPRDPWDVRLHHVITVGVS